MSTGPRLRLVARGPGWQTSALCALPRPSDRHAKRLRRSPLP